MQSRRPRRAAPIALIGVLAIGLWTPSAYAADPPGASPPNPPIEAVTPTDPAPDQDVATSQPSTTQAKTVEVGINADKGTYFVVHKDVLEYHALYLQVVGHGFTDRDGAGSVSILDPTTGVFAETAGLIRFPPQGQTFGVPFSSKRISSTRGVEGRVWVSQLTEDAFDLRYVRPQYKYIVWA